MKHIFGSNFKILVTFVCVKYAVSVTYVPPNRIIEAVQNDRYIFGIERYAEIEIGRCRVTSDTGIVHSFLVRPIYGTTRDTNDSSADLKENIISDRGSEGLCQVTVSNVQDNGPKRWNLKAMDYDNEIVAETSFTVNFNYPGSLLKYEIRVMEFSSFYNHMIMPSNIKLVSCYVTINDSIEIELDIDTPQTSVSVPPNAKNIEELAKRVSSLGHGYCGLKFVNATMDLKSMYWSLTAKSDRGIFYNGKFPTRIDQRISESNLNRIQYVSIGKQFKVQCFDPIASPFCSMFNPAGYLVEPSKCEHTITSFAMEHIGIWKCFNGFGNSMESLIYRVELRGISSEKIINWVNETENYVNIGCAVENYRGKPVNYCKMVAPNEAIFNTRPSFATDRHLSLGTNFTKGICSLMIRKPLQEYEEGLWRCEIKLEYFAVTGSYITVGPSKLPDYPKHLKVTTKVGEPFTVSCNVPYSSNYCRIQAPNGTVFKPDNLLEVSLGRCSLYVQQSASTENGTWSCSYGRETGTPDDVILVDVFIAEVLYHDKVVEVDVDHSAEFMCRSSLPLEYCRFISPDGVGYSIGNHENNSSGIGYLGKGFEYGECGIRIPKVQSSDKGYWTCVTKLVKDDDEELSAKILLNVKTPIRNEAGNSKIIKLSAKLRQSLTINCEVPYSTDYCHILSPMGTKYLPNKAEELNLGRCTFHIESASFSDQGAWTCMFARETGLPDEKIIVDVSFNEPSHPIHISEERVKENGTARLMCKMADIPLGYCRFNSPSAASYHIRDKDGGNSTRIKYYGKGLKYGECGIEISHVTLSDSGKWTCVFQPLPDGYEERNITLVVMQSEDIVI